MESILTSYLKRILKNSGKLEESGKILEKDLWVMSPPKRMLGNVAWETKNFPTVHQDQSSRCNYEGRV